MGRNWRGRGLGDARRVMPASRRRIRGILWLCIPRLAGKRSRAGMTTKLASREPPRIRSSPRPTSAKSTSCCARRCAASSRPRSSRTAQAWEEQGFVPREVLRRMGELGFLGIRYPAEYGGSRDGHARLRRAGRGTRPLDLRRRRDHRAGAYRHGLGAHGERAARRRRRRAGCRDIIAGRDDHRRRRHRAGRRLRREGHPHHRAPRRRRLRPQRRQDVHHQRRARRPLLRRRQDRAPTRGPRRRSRCSSSRRARPASASAARSTSTAGARPTPPSSCSRIAASRPRTCSARKAAASTPS